MIGYNPANLVKLHLFYRVLALAYSSYLLNYVKGLIG